MKTEMQALLQCANDGEIPSIEAYIIFSEIEKLAKDYKEQISKAAYDEVDRISDPNYTLNGRKITCQSRAVWDFKHISQWNDKNKELKEIEERSKMASKFGVNGNFDTGEIIEPAICKHSYFLKVEAIK